MDLISNVEAPFIKFGKQLLLDETTAAFFSAMLTALTFVWIWLTWGGDAPQWVFVLFLPLAGPFLEKPFLLLRYIFKARNRWVQNEKQEKYFQCFRSIWKEEDVTRIMRADIFYHDTLSWLFMLIATFMIPDLKGDFSFYAFLSTGEGLGAILITAVLAGVSFVLAVFGAAVLDVKITELCFSKFRKKITQKFGFSEPEEYCEILYLLSGSSQNMRDKCATKLKAMWTMKNDNVATHQETEILNHKLKGYNNWKPYLQIRYSSISGYSLQLIYEMPFEIKTKPTDAFRCFAVRKLKWKILIPEFDISAVSCKLNEFGWLANGEMNTFSVAYERKFFFNPGDLSFSIDTSVGEKTISWIETKIWMIDSFEEVLKKINKKVASQLPVKPSTRRKSETMAVLLNE